MVQGQSLPSWRNWLAPRRDFCHTPCWHWFSGVGCDLTRVPWVAIARRSIQRTSVCLMSSKPSRVRPILVAASSRTALVVRPDNVHFILHGPASGRIYSPNFRRSVSYTHLTLPTIYSV